ncbi:uncharacterized protein BcabD6B2_55790 [Babesia caballi]|uniref:Uncharacterized protein n=1 Tax=Babesia caballi TaxID=5871 RepID=A0AAV4M1T4_BABCB|nr:hypothetical protein, conserved [Babesia caballi]
MPAGKSLTTPPTNLKEAIDWVIQIKNDNNAINDLAKALEELLKHDDSEVAVKVLENYRLASQSVIEKLTPQKSERYFVHTALNNLSQGLKPFPSGSAAVSREKAERWVSSVGKSDLETLIGNLANGLKTFVEKDPGILQNSSATAYKSDAEWKSLKANERRDCAIIFLAIIPLLYTALTYMYWRCSQSPDSEDPFLSWSKQNLSESKGLKKYMEALGYSDKDLKSQNGGTIVSSVMNNLFSGELQKHTSTASSKTYPVFLGQLQKVLDSSPQLTSHPLTSLYFLSYYYIAYPLHGVQSTSPATPSFAGYSGLAALGGGAYGFNLGGLGTFMSALLA